MKHHLVEHPAACEETPALIAHVVEAYHETHRRELPELVALAQKVERVHGADPNAPHGLAQALGALMEELEAHMREEETLFSVLGGGGKAAAGAIAEMREDHGRQEQALARIAAITHGFRLPRGACRSWSALYDGVRKLVEDCDECLSLENDVLFPRFEGTPREPLAGA